MDSHRGKRMKIRLEIIDDDDPENTSIEFGGTHWKKCILAFIDSLPDSDQISAGSSSDSLSISSISQGQQSLQSSSAQPQVPQEPVMQQSMLPPVSQPAVQQPVSQQLAPVYQQTMSQMPVPQQPFYAAPGVPPYYYYNQPVQSAPSFVQQPVVQPAPVQQSVQPVNANVAPAVQQTIVQPVAEARKTPRFQERLNDSSLTISERLELFLKYEYPRVWFSSQDVQQHYERVYGSIKQSTVSTYLSRMFRKAILERRGNRTQREYKYIDTEVEMPVVSSGVPISEYHRI